MDIQRRIRRLMAEKGWSEYRLAKEAHLSQSTISHLFKRNNAPTLPTLESICRAFGLTLTQFFAEDGSPVMLSREQNQLLTAWGGLNREQQELIYRLIKDLGR